MASLSKEPGRSSWKLVWHDADKRRRSIRLGAMPKKTAEQFKVRFEELLGVLRGRGSIPAPIQSWIDSLPEVLQERLARADMIKVRERWTLGKLCDAYLESRSNVADATKVRDKQVVNRLLGYFGRDRLLESITVQDAEQWRKRLAADGNQRDEKRNELADNTVRRRTGVARQVFSTAIRWGHLSSNPFDGLATTVRANMERRAFIPWDDVLLVIEQAPSIQWKTLIAFVRLTGCRVPSELQGLRWADIDLAGRSIIIRSPKTAHHGGDHVMRSVPMFPELVPFISRLADAVGPGVDVPLSCSVFPMACDPAVNLRTQLTRMIVKAKLIPWPKLFVNLRSSRETELLAAYPAADVCRWMGHSPAVAARFYAQARPEVAERAAQEMTVGALAGNIGEESGENQEPSENCKSNQESPQVVGNQTVVTDEDGQRGIVKVRKNGRCRTRTYDPLLVRQVL